MALVVHVALVAATAPLPVRYWESCQSGIAGGLLPHLLSMQMPDAAAQSTREAVGCACCVGEEIHC